MSEPRDRDSGAAPEAVEHLSIAQFQEELRRIAGARPASLVENPLEAAVKTIVDNPAFTQSRLLARVLIALVRLQGEFRRAEIAVFDAATLALIIALMDAHAAGTATREAWLGAADRADAAQLGIGG